MARPAKASGVSAKSQIIAVDTTTDDDDNDEPRPAGPAKGKPSKPARQTGSKGNSSGSSRRPVQATFDADIHRPTAPNSRRLIRKRRAVSVSTESEQDEDVDAGENGRSDDDVVAVATTGTRISTVAGSTSKPASRQLEARHSEPRSSTTSRLQASMPQKKKSAAAVATIPSDSQTSEDEELPDISPAKRNASAPPTSAQKQTLSTPRQSTSMAGERNADQSSSKKSFVERLSQNATPKFSKQFRGRVKSSNETSIPLQDERFASDSDEAEYESEDKPSPRKKHLASKKQRESSINKARANARGTHKASQSSSKRQRGSQARTSSDDDFIVDDNEELVDATDSVSEGARSGKNRRASDVSGKGKGRASKSRGSSSTKQDVKKRHSHRQTTSDDDESLPDIPQKSDRAARLDELSSIRRKKEVLKKRVVSSPTPSPPPNVKSRTKAADEGEDDYDFSLSPRWDDSSSSPHKSKRVNVREVRSGNTRKKGGSSNPLFVSDSDGDDNDDDADVWPKKKKQSVKRKRPARAEDSEDDDQEVSDARLESRKGKLRRKLMSSQRSKRRGTDDSSSSSSSGSEDEAPAKPAKLSKAVDDDELEDDVENIALDYNPIKEDKLRPKDLSKLSRLDKLKQAREAKQKREERRLKGVIDSDEDEVKVKTEAAKVKSESEGEDDDDDDDDEEEELDLDANEEDFIIDDDEAFSDDAREKLEKMMPMELTRHGKLELSEHFNIFVTYLVYLYFFPRDNHLKRNKEWAYSREQVEKALVGVINSSVASSIWNENFRAALDARPEYSENFIPYETGCQGCDKRDRTASIQAVIGGKPYDPETFAEIEASDTEEEEELNEEQVFNLGRFCAERAWIHSKLRHFPYYAAQNVFNACRDASRLPKKLHGDRDDRRRMKDEEAVRIIKSWGTRLDRPLVQLWHEMRDVLETAKKKYTS